MHTEIAVWVKKNNRISYFYFKRAFFEKIGSGFHLIIQQICRVLAMVKIPGILSVSDNKDYLSFCIDFFLPFQEYFLLK